MRLAAFESNSGVRVGIVEEDVLHPLPPEHEMVAVLGMEAEAREVLASGARASGDAVALENVRLLPPLRPTTLRDFICFEQHVEGVVKIASPDAEVMPDWYDAPTFYFSSTNAIFGPGDEIEVPPGCELLDFELEVAAVIGCAGRDLGSDQAWAHIAGFTIYDDFSNRDAGGREARMGVGWAKAKDFAN